jgi:hypothetical protein
MCLDFFLVVHPFVIFGGPGFGGKEKVIVRRPLVIILSILDNRCEAFTQQCFSNIPTNIAIII